MPFYKKHGKMIYLGISIVIGVIIANLPQPAGFKPEGMKLLGIFIATIIAIIAQALPMGALTILALTAAVASNTLSITQALSGFSNPTIWLVVLAFFISRGFISTGLGNRAAYFFVRLLGKSTLGLGYGLMATDLILAPAIPSVTARAGGLIYPILTGLSSAFGSEAANKTSKKAASYLTQVAFQGTCVTSAMFLTSMAGNPMIRSIAQGSNLDISWGLWALAALIPGLISMLVIPLLIYKIYPPEIKHTPQAKALADRKLKELGPMSVKEWIMLAVFVLLVILWAGEAVFKIKPVTAAFIGISILLITKVLNWKDVLTEQGAWDTFIWLSLLVMLATSLADLGVTSAISGWITTNVTGLNWVAGFIIIALLYFFTHYLFASNIAHITALFAPFLVLAISIGVPPMLIALTMAFFSSLFGSLTHYGCGPAPIFFSAGHVDIRSWWKIGLIVSIVNVVIWMGIGTWWWKILGLWAV